MTTDGSETVTYPAPGLGVLPGPPVVYPEQFGAVGDGVADDTAAVRAALLAATVVQFTPGKSYAISSQVSIPSGRTLIGYGARLVAVGLADTTSMFINAVTSGSPERDSEMSFIGLEFDGNSLGKGGDARRRTLPLIRILRGRNVRMIDCWVHDTGYIGVQFNACDGVLVRGCVFERCGWDGEVSTDAGPALVVWSTFAGETSEEVAITNCRFQNNEWSHLYLSAYGASVTNCVMNGCYEAAIWAYNRDDLSTGPLCRRLTITGNVMQNIRLKAVSAQAIEATAIDFVIANNVVFDTDLGGIVLYHAERGIVSGNVVMDTGKQAVIARAAFECISGATRGNCEDIVITGNSAYDSGGTMDHAFLAFTRSGEADLPATGITVRNNHFGGPFVSTPIDYTLGSLDITTCVIRDNLGADDVSGVSVPGPYANDAAAEAAGVQIGQGYRLTATDAVMVRAV